MSRSNFLHTKLIAISSKVPKDFINIDDELEFFGNDQWLLNRNKKILGLGKRHVAPESVTNLDLCAAAAEDILENTDRKTIDSVIAVSTSHDYHYPATACILQHKLNLSENCSCLDISGLACSGYVYGLWLAHSLIESGAAKRCLLLSGDIASKHSDRRNRNSNPLFGDAGTATLLEYTNTENPAWFITGTRGSGWDRLIAPAGGYYLPVRADIADLEVKDDAGNVWRLYDDIMHGLDIFKFSTDVGPKGIKEILEFAGREIDDIDYFAFHQANKQIIRTVAMHAGLPKNKFSADVFTQYGNCTAAAIAMDLCQKLYNQKLDWVTLASFGVGLSWGFAVLNVKETKSYGIGLFETPGAALSRQEKIEYWISQFQESTNAARK